PYHVPLTFAQLVVFALAAFAFFTNRFRWCSTAPVFWVIVLVSTEMAAAIVLNDDGWRALHVTNILIGCLLALGFATPAAPASLPVAPLWRWQAGAVVATCTIALFLTIPYVSHTLMLREIARHPPIAKETGDTHVVLGGRFITGFVVMPDGTDRP